MKISKSGTALKQLTRNLKQINVQFTCKKIQMGLSHTHTHFTDDRTIKTMYSLRQHNRYNYRTES